MFRRSYPRINDSNTLSAQEADILKNSRRRGIIKALSSENSTLDSLVGLFLEEEDELVDKGRVAEQVAAMEEGKPVEEVSEGTMKSVQVTNHQHHLPILDDEDLVNYYPEQGLIEPLELIDEYKDMVEDRPHEHSVLPGTEDPEQGSGLTYGDTYEVLSNERRRHTLDYMSNSEKGTVALGNLSEHIAREEKDEEETLTSGKRKTVYIGLAQCHLPKMDEVDVIDYDDDRKTVERGKYFEEVADHLPQDLEELSPKQRYRAKAFSVLPLF